MVQIAVIGSGRPISPEVEKIAEEVGKEIAKAKATLVCGGMHGVMEAASKGAKSQGGLTVGIIPRGLDEGNKYLDVKIPPKIGYARNYIVANSGDAVIVINGAFGTLTELAFAVAHEKPVIVIEGTGGITDLIDELVKIPEIKSEIGQFNSKILKAKNAKEAVELALSELKP